MEKKYIHTVTGLVEPESIGNTLMHEHIFIDLRSRLILPKDAIEKEHFERPVSEQNYTWLKENLFRCRDNVVLSDMEVAIKELNYAKMSGIDCIVECTNQSIGRSPKALQEISYLTGIKVIMSTGHYIGNSQAAENELKSVSELEAEMVSDIENGVGYTDIHAGIIGEIGIESFDKLKGINQCEEKSLRAAARAQKKTKASIQIHTLFREVESGMDYIIRVLEEEGADLERVILCHQDLLFHVGADVKVLEKFAAKGCCISYDKWGDPRDFRNILDFNNSWPLPTCDEKLKTVKRLIDDGFEDRILFSHDCCCKSELRSYGGHGYSYLLDTIAPTLRSMGVSNQQIAKVFIHNPRKVLAF